MSLQQKTREQFKVLYENGVKSMSKLMTATGKAKSTIYKWINKLKERNNIVRSPGSGRRRTLSQGDRRYFRRLAVNCDRFSNRKLASRILEVRKVKISRFTVAKELKDAGLVRLAPNPVPMMTKKQQQKRLEWCLEHKDFNWHDVIFTDESRFMFYNKCPKLISRVGQRKSLPRPKHSPSEMLWGGISFRGRTPLATVNGIIDSKKYCDILNGYLLPTIDTLYPDGYKLQEDNASVHKSKR